MPLIPSGDFNRAKKRMRLGLHPAVVAAAQQAITGDRGGGSLGQQTTAAFDRGEIPLSLGSGVNQRPGPSAFGRPIMGSRQGQKYQASIQRTPSGALQEVHDYGGGQRVAFTRKPSSALTAQLQAANPTLSQHMSNTATADDKLLAMAVRQAAAGKLAGGIGVRRRFDRHPGFLRRY